MAKKRPFFAFGIASLIGLLLIGCGHPSHYETSSVNLATFSKTAQKVETHISYYDFERSSNNLIMKVSTTTAPNPDKLKLAITQFIKTTNFFGRYKSLNFQQHVYKFDKTEFYFEGKYEFKRKEDLQIFKKALKLTIAKYINNTNIDLIINGQKL